MSDNNNPVARWTEDQLLGEVSGCYARLSLAGQTGKLSLSQARQERETAGRDLRILFRELGRKVSKLQCEQWQASRDQD